MPIATQLQTQIAAIKARIDTVAATATPEDIVMLAKAVEAIAGQVTVFDVMAAGEERLAEVEAGISTASAAAQAEIDSKLSTAVSELDAAKTAALASINPDSFSVAAIHAAALSI